MAMVDFLPSRLSLLLVEPRAVLPVLLPIVVSGPSLCPILLPLSALKDRRLLASLAKTLY